MTDFLYLIIDTETNIVQQTFASHSEAFAALRQYAEPGEQIERDTVRAGYCIRRLSLIEAVRILIEGKVIS